MYHTNRTASVIPDGPYMTDNSQHTAEPSSPNFMSRSSILLPEATSTCQIVTPPWASLSVTSQKHVWHSSSIEQIQLSLKVTFTL